MESTNDVDLLVALVYNYKAAPENESLSRYDHIQKQVEKLKLKVAIADEAKLVKAALEFAVSDIRAIAGSMGIPGQMLEDQSEAVENYVSMARRYANLRRGEAINESRN